MKRRARLARELIDRYQHDLPMTVRPFAEMARAIGSIERDVLDLLEDLTADGVLSRVGAVIPPGVLGVSTLAALAAPAGDLDDVAALVSSYPEVNHNYEREHALNLWFVATASDRARLDRVLDDIRRRTGLAVIEMPLERAYRIDLGFKPSWN
jgi:DNA-binding Lrp family transcriptional regulator